MIDNNIPCPPDGYRWRTEGEDAWLRLLLEPDTFWLRLFGKSYSDEAPFSAVEHDTLLKMADDILVLYNRDNSLRDKADSIMSATGTGYCENGKVIWE